MSKYISIGIVYVRFSVADTWAPPLMFATLVSIVAEIII